MLWLTKVNRSLFVQKECNIKGLKACTGVTQTVTKNCVVITQFAEPNIPRSTRVPPSTSKCFVFFSYLVLLIFTGLSLRFHVIV